MVSGRVTELWRFPVKSMAGEQVDRLELDHDGVVGDRRFAVRDDESGLIASAKRPGRWGVLLACRAATAADGRVLVTMPDGPTFPAGDPLLDTALSELTGRRVTFEHVDGRSADASGDHEVVYPELDHVRLRGRMAFPTAMMTDARSYVDLAAVHLMTTSTIAAVAAASEADDVSSSRFRPNIVIDSGPAVEFLEDDWAGATLCVGPNATLQRVISAPRCIMTSASPRSARPERSRRATRSRSSELRTERTSRGRTRSRSTTKGEHHGCGRAEVVRVHGSISR